MHELSLVQGIFDSVIPVARQNGATKITGIKLTIGEMTMVVPEAMEFAFEALSEDDRCSMAACSRWISWLRSHVAWTAVTSSNMTVFTVIAPHAIRQRPS